MQLRWNMAIHNILPGQLAVLWVGGLWLEYFAARIISINGGRDLSFTLVAGDPMLLSSLEIELVCGIMNLLLITIPTLLLIVTWKWFGSRTRP